MSKIALVTGGAGSGIGAKSCEALARDGFTVAVTDIRGDAAAAVAGKLAKGGHAAYSLDVSDETQVSDIFERVETELGPIVVLVCCAGIMIAPPGRIPSIAEISTADWDKTFAINIRGTFFCIREYIKRRRAAAVENGRIITLSSAAAHTGGVRGGGDYAASKAAVLALTKTVSREAATLGITTNAIAPGPVDTPMFREMWPAGTEGTLLETMPFGRLIAPEEIAELVAYLASPAAASISGSTIDINGGYLVR